ncbi:MAG TPA: DUF4340 domain-containing protein, partial [Beijerinckiaceae bacterium]|nr:DUF4340 domain-containing protein [Beijerinckiaceae bacterium]
AVAGAGVALRVGGGGETTNAGENQVLFPGLASETAQLTHLHVKTPAYELQMEQHDGNWVAADRGNYPLRAATVANVLTGLGELRKVEPKTTNPDLYARIGVEDPSAKGAGSSLVGLEQASGSLGELIIGKRAESIGFDPLGGTFVRRPGDAQSWLAQGSPTIPSELLGWFDELPAFSSVDVSHLTVSEGGKTVFDAVKDGDTYKPAPAATDGAAPVTTQVNDAATKRLAQVVSTGSFDDVGPADKVSFADNARKVHFELANGATVDITIGTRDGKPWVRYQPSATPTSSAAAPVKAFGDRGKTYAFALPDYQMSALALGIDQLTAPASEANTSNLPTPPSVVKQTTP